MKLHFNPNQKHQLDAVDEILVQRSKLPTASRTILPLRAKIKLAPMSSSRLFSDTQLILWYCLISFLKHATGNTDRHMTPLDA